jgi:probable HAF family extracellular repeat protein
MGPSAASVAAINNAGQVVGDVGFSGGFRSAFLYSAGTFSYIAPGAQDSYATDINDSGVVVGGATLVDRFGAVSFVPFSWSNQSGFSTGGFPPQFAAGINNSGTTIIRDIGSLYGPNAINDAGHTAGEYSSNVGRPYLRTGPLTLIDLGSLRPDNTGSGWATAVNNADQVIGDSYAQNGNGQFSLHAFLWQASTGMVDLGTLGGVSSSAIAINNGGDAVGRFEFADGGNHAFLYTSGTMMDLNSLLPSGSGWQLYSASAINDRGQIAGIGSYNGVDTAFLMTPTPEPQTIAAGVFLVALMVAGRRRRAGNAGSKKR